MTISRSEGLPFALVATLGSFLRELDQREGVRVEGVSGMATPHGGVRSRRVVRVGADGAKRLAVLPNLDDRDAVSVVVIRSICRSLGLPPADYGA